MSEPKNQMEALIRTIEARGKVYWDHTEIDNKALDDVQTVFDFEVKKLEEENEKLRSFLYDLANMISGGDEDYACREITQWHREQCDD